MLAVFTQPSLVDVRIAALFTIAVIVRCAAGRAFAIATTIIGICGTFCGGCISVGFGSA